MFSENVIIFHVDDIHCVFHVIFFQILKNFQLNASLIVVFLFVFYNLDSEFLFTLVVKCFHSYTETTFSKKAQYFVAISYVIFDCNPIITFTIIKSEIWVLFVAASPRLGPNVQIMRTLIHNRLYLFYSLTKIINLWVV